MKPKFSIITVTYNATLYLEKTILSIINQTYSNIEYIIIDGNSQDGTVELIKKYADRIFYWASEPDKGLYDAMNKGLQKATGDYVWFINAGDRIYQSNTIEKIVSSFLNKNHIPDILYGKTIVVDSENKELGLRRLMPPKKLTWKSFRMGMLVCHQSFIPQKKISPSYNLDYQYSSDYNWCIECLKKANYIYNTDLVLSSFMECGLSTKNRKKSLKERFEIMCKHYGYIGTFFFHGWFGLRFYWAKWVKGRV